MKILQINNTYMNLGGSEKYLFDICAELERDGHETVILSSADFEHIQTDRRKEYFIPPSGGYRSGRIVFRQIEEILEMEKPDVIHLHNTHWFLSPLITRKLPGLCPTVRFIHDVRLFCLIEKKLIRNGETVCTYPLGADCFFRRCYRHGFELDCYPERTARFFLGWVGLTFLELSATKKVHVLIVGSEYMKRELIRNHFDGTRIVVAPLFLNDVPDRKSLPEKKKDLIFYVGRFDGTKGADELIQSLNLLKDESWHAVMLGDGKYKEGAAQRIEATGLSGRITLQERIAREDVYRYYGEAMVVVMPSMIPESFGYVGLEAFAHGTPVIAFNVGGVEQWLKDGMNGYLLERGDVEGLAEKIRFFLNNPGEAERMGRQGRVAVEEEFSGEKHMAMVFQAYEQAMDLFCRRN